MLSNHLITGCASRLIAILSNHKRLHSHALARLKAFDTTVVLGGANIQLSNHSGVTGCPAYGEAVHIVLIAANKSLVMLSI